MSSHDLSAAAWTRFIWESDLKPLEKLVALAFADRCRGPVVWVSINDLITITGLSRDAAHRALTGVVSAGWLVKVQDARQHQATRYRLAQRSAARTPDDVQRSASRTAESSFSVPSQQYASRNREERSSSRRSQQYGRRTAGGKANSAATPSPPRWESPPPIDIDLDAARAAATAGAALVRDAIANRTEKTA
jgi:DNA-binding transcriptional regulator PaaX